MKTHILYNKHIKDTATLAFFPQHIICILNLGARRASSTPANCVLDAFAARTTFALPFLEVRRGKYELSGPDF